LFSLKLEGSFQTVERYTNLPVHGHDDPEAEKSSETLSGSPLGKPLPRVHDMVVTGRPSLEYMKTHPEEDSSIHVVV
jgi:hypothetical protein